jgi:poly(beta-D-mannuronate) lyase
MNTVLRQISLSFCLLLVVGQLSAVEHGPIDSAKSFSEVIRKAQAGDAIVIADGRYDGWSAEMDCRGTAKLPVTIRPESVGGVVFAGRSHFSITGSYIALEGMRFGSGTIITVPSYLFSCKL